MKIFFLALLIAVGLIGSISAQTTADFNNTQVAAVKIDFSEYLKTSENFFKALDKIQNSPTTDDSPDKAVKVIDAWASAFSNYGKGNQDFAKKHPEVLTQTTPPPEVLNIMGKFALMKTEYAPALQRLNSLITKYHSYPQVQEALRRYQASLEEIDKLIKM